MNFVPRIACTLGIFVVTLTLILVKPRRWNEAWWAVSGACATLGLGLVSLQQVQEMVLFSRSTLLFLLALLVLSSLLESSGFFEWAAIHASRHAAGDGRHLFRNVFVLGAFVTMMLSLDTTAVMLTPIVVAFVVRLNLPARPYVVATAFVANVASLLLPMSNLTNLLFVNAFHISFVRFAWHMWIPQIVVLVVTYALLRWHFRGELRAHFDPAALPDPATVVQDSTYFRWALAMFCAVLVGYFVGPWMGAEPYVVAFGGAAVLGVVGVVRGRVGPSMVRTIGWSLFPLVIGLFVVVKGIENLGIVEVASGWLARTTDAPFSRALMASGATCAASNVMNNLPAALLARSVLHSSPAPSDDVATFGALLGLNVGPTILPTGSLATLLVLDVARKKGQFLRSVEVIKVGVWLTPLVLLAAVATSVWFAPR